MNTIKSLFGLSPKTDYAALIKNGAILADVRSKAAYQSGNIWGPINIPLDQLGNNLARLKNKTIPVITCCASGIRSASAKSILLSKGYQQVYNGGGWGSLRDKL